MYVIDFKIQQSCMGNSQEYGSLPGVIFTRVLYL